MSACANWRQNAGAIAPSFRILCASRRELFLSTPIRLRGVDKKSPTDPWRREF